VRAALGLLLLVGCDFVFRLDEVRGVSSDALVGDGPGGDAACGLAAGPFQPVSCGSVAFGATPVELPGLAGSVAGDPSIRGDKLEVYFTAQGTTTPFRIGRAIRPDLVSPFEVTAAPLFVDPTANEYDPSVNATGEFVAFSSDRGGYGAHALLAQRTSCDTWTVVPMPGLEDQPMSSLDLSWDALTIYFTDQRILYQARRPNTSLPFGPKVQVAVDIDWPAVSSDDRELYFVPVTGGGVYRAQRTDPDGPFGVGSLVTSFGGDPDLIADGTVLILLRAGMSAQVLTRTCP
jgi:hypothetical protein